MSPIPTRSWRLTWCTNSCPTQPAWTSASISSEISVNRVRLWQLDEGEHPPLRSMRAELNNLPVQLTEFIGRRAEVEQLDRLLADHRLVTVSGMGGCGKARITLRWPRAGGSATTEERGWPTFVPRAIPTRSSSRWRWRSASSAEGRPRGAAGWRSWSSSTPIVHRRWSCSTTASTWSTTPPMSRTICCAGRSRYADPGQRDSEALGTDGERWRIPSMGADWARPRAVPRSCHGGVVRLRRRRRRSGAGRPDLCAARRHSAGNRAHGREGRPPVACRTRGRSRRAVLPAVRWASPAVSGSRPSRR